MLTLYGQCVSDGVAVGKLFYYDRATPQIVRRTADDPAAELARFRRAQRLAFGELAVLHDRAVHTVGAQDAEIFSVHQMMIDDLDYYESVQEMIEGKRMNAEAAVYETANAFAQVFASMGDPVMRARAADVQDVSRRMIGILTGRRDALVIREPCIVAADDLSPSETVGLSRELLLGIVTSGGSANSHTAILARTMGIPALTALGGLDVSQQGKTAALDADGGALYIEPDASTEAALRKKQRSLWQASGRLRALVGQENVTRDGRKIEICANINGLADIPAVRESDAGGIGLFRSEYLYFGRSDYPDEETQYQTYRRLLEQMAGKRVVIRTLDAGADKQADYFKLPPEQNPALGLRAIRLCLRQPALFKTQLRALLRASVHGRLAVLFPMIASKPELLEAKALLGQVKADLDAEGIPWSPKTELGIMIETPAAAIISDMLAGEVDFFSVGTNDLTQYTLAADRGNPALREFIDPRHEAVLRLIELAARSAHQAGRRIAICGELAADTALTERFLRMGIDELSVVPARVLPLRAAVRQTDLRARQEA